MRTRMWFVVALLVTPSLSQAQVGDVTLPGNLILPNYARVTVGQAEGLEGGAFIARTGNALSNWYNPAGLVKAATAELNASATAYEQTSIQLEGLTTGAKGSRLATIGSFFGGVLGSPIFDGDNLRLGFSVTTPVQWRPGTITGASHFNLAGKSNDVGVTTEVELSQMIPGLALGFRTGGALRMGAGLGVAVTGLSQRLALTVRQVSADSVLTATRTSTSEGSSYEGLVQAGAQWDLGSRFILGAHVVSPGLHILGSSKLSFESGVYRADRYEDTVIRDQEADFEYRIPVKAGAGIAYKLDRGEVEADVSYHGATDPYALYESAVTGTRTVLVGGVPAVTSPSMSPRANDWESVTNWAVGGNYRINERVRLHAGFYTDASPVSDPTVSMFRKVDLTGWTGGASWQGDNFSGSLGLGYSSGKSDRLVVTDAGSGVRSETSLTVRSLRAAYAISFTF